MRVSTQQRSRTQNNPLVVGTFDQLSVRNLTGKFGPQNKVVGRADTNFISNGGYGEGAYNHWFQVNLSAPAWIILAKGGTKPKYINVAIILPIETPANVVSPSNIPCSSNDFKHPI